MRSTQPRNRPSHLVLFAIGAIALAAPITAGTLDVNASAAFGGSFGLEVTLGLCTPTDLVIGPPPATISGTFLGCQALTAGGVEVVDPGATFWAAADIGLDDDFTVGPAAPFVAALAPELDSPFAWVESDAPDRIGSYSASFRLDLDDLALAPGDELDHLTGHAANGDVLFRVTLLRHGPSNENRLVLAARRDSGGFVETPSDEQLLVPAGYNQISIRWVASSGAGHLLASINESVPTGLTGLVNATSELDSVRWGAVAGSVDSSSGSFFLDDFSSFR